MSYYAPRPTQTSALAVWSLSLGILGFFCCPLTALPAVILGHMALVSISVADGRLEGRGLAIAGLVLGYLFLIILVGALAVPLLAPRVLTRSMLPAMMRVHSDEVEIHAAIKAYHQAYGHYPGVTTTHTDTTFGEDNQLVFAPLRGPDKANPKGIVFFRSDAAPRPGLAGFDQNGVLRDPWGRPYFIRLDTDHDGSVANPYGATSGELTVSESVIIWSLGPDGKLGNDGDGNRDADYTSW